VSCYATKCSLTCRQSLGDQECLPFWSSAHASRHKATRLWMTIQVVRPNHRVAGAIRPIYDSFIRHIHPLAVDAHAIVTILGVPIGIVYALRITAVAARSLATVQALIPTVQLWVVMIVGASAADCNDEQHGRQNCQLCVPNAMIHVIPTIAARAVALTR
jgi:hypothetical protein